MKQAEDGYDKASEYCAVNKENYVTVRTYVSRTNQIMFVSRKEIKLCVAKKDLTYSASKTSSELCYVVWRIKKKCK